jgi:hypothetical protein
MNLSDSQVSKDTSVVKLDGIVSPNRIPGSAGMTPLVDFTQHEWKPPASYSKVKTQLDSPSSIHPFAMTQQSFIDTQCQPNCEYTFFGNLKIPVRIADVVPYRCEPIKPPKKLIRAVASAKQHDLNEMKDINNASLPVLKSPQQDVLLNKKARKNMSAKSSSGSQKHGIMSEPVANLSNSSESLLNLFNAL